MFPKQLFRFIQDLSGATDEDARFMVPLFSVTLIIIIVLGILVLL